MLVYGRNVIKEVDKKKIRKIYISSKELIPYLKEEKLKFDIVPKKKIRSNGKRKSSRNSYRYIRL